MTLSSVIKRILGLSIRLPEKSDVIIYDSEGSLEISRLLAKRNYSVFAFREGSISLIIAILALLKYGVKIRFRHYAAEYILHSHAICAITYIDNDPNFYLLKHLLPHVTFIAVQNGYRDPILFSILSADYRKSLFMADYIFVFNSSLAAMYGALINSKVVAHGSLKSNSCIKIPVQSCDVVFISQYIPLPMHKSNKPYMPIGPTLIPYDEFYQNDKNLILKLLNYCSSSGYSFGICGRTDNHELEVKFFESCLGFNRSFKYFPNTEQSSSIQHALSAKLVVFLDSTLGFEVLALGQKCAIFSIRKFSHGHRSLGWECNLPEEGPFWSSCSSLSRFESIMNYSMRKTMDDWNEENKDTINKLVMLDPGNRSLIASINESFP